jgi:hypothetical protein
MRTKFQLWEITKTAGFDGVNLTFRPVMNGCEENKSFSKYTPSGEIKLCVSNPNAVEGFEVGQEYFVDFQLVPIKQDTQDLDCYGQP